MRFLFTLLLLIGSTNLFSQLNFNELMSSNSSDLLNKENYNYVDWLELYNEGSSSINLRNYYLSDDKNILQKWQLPYYALSSGDYKVFYCDGEGYGYHTNFKLASSGETIYLYNSSTNSIEDSVYIVKQHQNISYGKNNNGVWKYCIESTPGESNKTVEATIPANEAYFSDSAGWVYYNKQISMFSFGTNSEVRYTTDGSEPSNSSPIFSTPLVLKKTSVVKTRVYQDDYLPSDIYANTYFVRQHAVNLPVISLSFNPEFFWDNQQGIYVQGTNGVSGNCLDYPVNWNQNWERGGYLEFFDTDGIKQLSQSVGIKISGGCTRTADQKSLSIYARGKYGDSDFDYAIFPAKKKVERYKSFLIRNSGNDWNTTILRDAFMQQLIANTGDVDYQEYQPAVIYLNGAYWGFMNVREKLDEDYFYSNYKLSEDSIDFLEGDAWVIRGSNAEYNSMIEYARVHNLSNNSYYKHVADQIDMESYIDYMTSQIYVSNTDWPGNNIKFWRAKNNGKWRWLLYDTDFGWGLYGGSPTHETFHFVTDPYGPNWPNPPWSTLLFRSLLDNEGFKKQFVASFLTHTYSTYNPDRCKAIIDSLTAIIDSEVSYQKQQFGGTYNDWQNEINNLKSWSNSRFQFMPEYTKEFFGLNGEMASVNFDYQRNDGTVKVNGVRLTNYPFSYNAYKNLPFSFEAIPRKGYRFVEWQHASGYESLKLIGFGDNWYYRDVLSDYPLNWKETLYNHSAWSNGNGQLGYGDGDETTLLSYGANSNDKVPTALFRKNLTLDTAGYGTIIANVMADDGAVVYLNGVEVFRINMPEGPVNFNTYSTGGDDNGTYQFTIDNSLFKNGVNTIAVEVHQVSATSSDLSFDFSLSTIRAIKGKNGTYSSQRAFSSDTTYSLALMPVFEPIEEVPGIVINEICESSSYLRDNLNEKSGFIEFYNSTDEAINIGGWYLTDKLENKERYEFPENTIIPAKGFGIVYADGEVTEGPLHTTFNLDNDGETISLIQKVGDEYIIADSVSYPFLQKNISFGRYTDGSSDRAFMKTPTPNQANTLDEPPVGITAATNSMDQLTVYPNPNSGVMTITTSPGAEYRVMVSTISGKIMERLILAYDRENTVNISHLENGLYFFTITDEFGNSKVLKVIKR